MKYFPCALFFISLTACNSLFADRSGGGSKDTQQPSTEQVIRLSIGGSTLLVYPHNFEATQTCPKVHLLDANDSIIDQASLCQVNIDGYKPFEAHSDFAFIHFENYRIDKRALAYDVDLALIRGSAFVARCHLPVRENDLGTPTCQRLDEAP